MTKRALILIGLASGVCVSVLAQEIVCENLVGDGYRTRLERKDTNDVTTLYVLPHGRSAIDCSSGDLITWTVESWFPQPNYRPEVQHIGTLTLGDESKKLIIGVERTFIETHHDASEWFAAGFALAMTIGVFFWTVRIVRSIGKADPDCI